LVRNSSGQTVATLHPTDLSSGNHYLTFDGFSDTGERLPAGTYSLVLQARSSDEEEPVAASPLVRTVVTGVDLTDEGVRMVTDIGEFSISDIHGVYDRNSIPQNEQSEETDNEFAQSADEVIETAAAAIDAVDGLTTSEGTNQ